MHLDSPLSEFEIQAIAFCNLKMKYGRFVRGELTRKGLKAHGRFDIVIFDSNKKIAIVIECKKKGKKMSKSQSSLYEELSNATVIEINELWQAESICEVVDSYIKLRNINL